jgi:hypothetical protein
MRVAAAARGQVLRSPHAGGSFTAKYAVTTALARAATLHQPPLPAPQPTGLPGFGLSAAEGCGMLSITATVYRSRLSAHRRAEALITYLYSMPEFCILV